jgi:hypothetical protein
MSNTFKPFVADLLSPDIVDRLRAEVGALRAPAFSMAYPAEGCRVCGLRLDVPMGYVCSNQKCPTSPRAKA